MLRNRLVVATLVTMLLAGAPGTTRASRPPVSNSPRNLTHLSLAELLNIEVYSAAKKEQRLSHSAAAVYVLTGEEIRRSGATSLPEALRLVPGVEVGRIDANKWAITMRGFNERFANKLLVMIDGRSVYTPLFAGVYWDVQDVFIEDIDRIEIVRGPGGALWGANAMNGVINVITRNAADTQDWSVAAGGGHDERGFGRFRYGTTLGGDAHVRVHGRAFDRDSYASPLGGQGEDPWDAARAGLRLDWAPPGPNTMMVEWDAYRGTSRSRGTSAQLDPPYSVTAPERTDVSGGHLLARWTRSRGAEGGELSLRGFLDRTDRAGDEFRELRHTADLELQQRVAGLRRHDIVWGVGYRMSQDRIRSSFEFTYTPASRTDHLWSGFLQDEMSLAADRLKLTLGTKVENNDYTGAELQPNARFLWKLGRDGALWGAVSRAVRTPSRAEADIRINTRVIPAGAFGPGNPPLPTIIAMFGDPAFRSEELLAYELGYRVQPGAKVSVDIAAFYNDYDHLRTVTPDPARPTYQEDDHLVMPLFATNFMKGTARGVEVATEVRPAADWRLRAGYSFMSLTLDLGAAAGLDPVSGLAEGSSPRHQAFVRSLLDLGRIVDLDLSVRWVDALLGIGVPSYWGLDARLGVTPLPGFEVSVVGQNLIEEQHQEFVSSVFAGTESTRTERGVYLTAMLRR